MARRRPIDAWVPYLDEVLALWTELGDGFRVGGLNRAQVTELRNQLRATLDKLNALQAQLGLAADERDRQISDINEFAVKFRSAVIAQYGPQSSQAKRVPRVDTPRNRSTSPAVQAKQSDAAVSPATKPVDHAA